MEAVLTSLYTTTVEVEDLHELIMDLHVVKKPIPSVPMNYDN
jgi:hypothetical protein